MTQDIPIVITMRHLPIINGITHPKRLITTFTTILHTTITYYPPQFASLIATII
jgi:hypothetical protein